MGVLCDAAATSPASSDGPAFGIADEDDDGPSGLVEASMDTHRFGSSSDSEEEVGTRTALSFPFRLVPR